jgi:hypothetical protein
VSAGLDLSTLDAFADLPDDARAAFARAATVNDVAREEEITGFALALVLDGAFDVAAQIVDASAMQLAKGAVLRSRGTLEEPQAMRLLCASDKGRVATWSDEAVDEAFRTCPWVEDDLRAAADRAQALVGATMGPLGERLDAGLRTQVTDKLTLRVLEEGETYAVEGEPVPGLLVVGAGDIELVRADAVTGKLTAGEFLFANEVLAGQKAPATARAAKGGALVLVTDRKAAQELLVTCPPLLEIFAGM